MNKIILFSLSLLLVACANPLNQVTYERYLQTGAEAEQANDAAVAEIAYSRALGNVYMGNLGPQREAEALFNLGRLERINGKFNDSLEHLLKSLEIDENINKADASILKSTLGEIAKTYYVMGKYNEGSQYLDKLNNLDKNAFYSAQSKKFISKLFADYAVKLKEMGLTKKADSYQKIANELQPR